MQILSPVDKFNHWVAVQPDKTFLRQPFNGEWIHISWKKADDEIRRMAAYLRSLNLPPQSKIAIISKNCAHWIMSDLAIMMAGHV
ncbi:MAG: AMP-binding protein, partial [Chitinophagales bacterium]|nr:AMP-binding protein [Chitinophagales bacterium]